LGGPWLALITSGHTPRINTADKADDLLTIAARHPVPEDW
jgi:hypothetical protein